MCRAPSTTSSRARWRSRRPTGSRRPPTSRPTSLGRFALLPANEAGALVARRALVVRRRTRGAIALEVRVLHALGIEPEDARVLGEEPAHVDRGRQPAVCVALERLQVRDADLRTLRDLAELDAERLAHLAQDR